MQGLARAFAEHLQKQQRAVRGHLQGQGLIGVGGHLLGVHDLQAATQTGLGQALAVSAAFAQGQVETF
jgi:hypothetical protein